LKPNVVTQREQRSLSLRLTHDSSLSCLTPHLCPGRPGAGITGGFPATELG
jgi:hypothetical protein